MAGFGLSVSSGAATNLDFYAITAFRFEFPVPDEPI